MQRRVKRSMILEHRVAACDYRYVWSRCPEHQRAGWRNAALTHEALVRAYARERNPTLFSEADAAPNLKDGK